MAAGQGYIEFATGDVLTAAAANGYLASQVVMVFASAAARTSAIASPQEGMISYLKDTNSTEYYSGSAWVAIGGAAAASGLTLISTTTLNASSSFNISNIFSSTYKNYLILGNDLVGSGSNYYTFGLRTGSTNATSAYAYYQYRFTYAGSNQTGTQTNASSLSALDYSNSDATAASFVLALNSPFETKATGFDYSTSYYTSAMSVVGQHQAATSYDSMWFTLSSGTLSGKIYVYGYGL